MSHSCIVFSIPRAGTHVVMRLLYLLGLKEHHVDWSDNLNLFKSPRRGHYMFGGHLSNTPVYGGQLLKSGLRTVYITRDLRDVAVSIVFFEERIEVHPYHDFFMGLEDRDERLKYAILGVDELHGEARFPSVSQRYYSTVGWRQHPNVYSTRFESLIGSRGGGSDELQELTMREICDHLCIRAAGGALQKCRRKLWGKRGNQYAENIGKGVIGNWRNHFKLEHKELAKAAFGHILIQEGYEKDLDW